MSSSGFVVLHCEWRHFEFGTRRWAAITGNQPRYGPAPTPALIRRTSRLTESIDYIYTRRVHRFALYLQDKHPILYELEAA